MQIFTTLTAAALSDFNGFLYNIPISIKFAEHLPNLTKAVELITSLQQHLWTGRWSKIKNARAQEKHCHAVFSAGMCWGTRGTMGPRESGNS